MVVKLSVNTLSWSKGSARDQALDLFAMIDAAHRLRLDGISIDAREFESTEAGYLKRVRRACVERGLAIDYIGVPASHNKEGAEARRENITMLRGWVDVAAELGVGMVRTFGGQVGEGDGAPGGRERAEAAAWPNIVASLQE